MGVQNYANNYLQENPQVVEKYNSPSEIIIRKEKLQTSSVTAWLRGAGAPEELAVYIRNKLFQDVSYWESIPLMPKAAEILEKLCKRHDVFIATSVFLANSEPCMIGKPRWIKKYLPFFDIQKLIYTHFKYNLRGDCIIEDVISQVLPFRGMKIIMSYPYNLYNDTYENQIIRVENWEQIERLLLL